MGVGDNGLPFWPFKSKFNLQKYKPLRDNFHHQKSSKHVSSWIYAYIKRWMKSTIGFKQGLTKHHPLHYTRQFVDEPHLAH
jgi:hypothetical protein